MSCSLDSLKGMIRGSRLGASKKDTRRLDYGSHGWDYISCILFSWYPPS